MEKWKKAVIHLECMADKESFRERMQRLQQIQNDSNEGKITDVEFSEQLSNKDKEFSWGTAIFVEYKDNYYLITSRHVLWDENAAEQVAKEEEEHLKGFGENLPPEILQSANERILNQSFESIFRVPSYSEYLQNSKDNARVINLMTGPPMYSFSPPELDVAVVSFKNRGRNFLKEIVRLNHEPISFNDIEDSCSEEGADVFTVGFPGVMSFIGQTSELKDRDWRSSSLYSLPSFSFGKISMLHDELPFYWADMSIYPGNSGGPVFEDEKLVGIVSGQPLISVEKFNELQVRIPFAKIIKAKYIKELILKQEQRDAKIAEFYQIHQPLGL